MGNRTATGRDDVRRTTYIKGLALAFSALFCLGMLAVPVSAEGAQAPQWQVGDSWAMGKAFDMGSNLSSTLHGMIGGIAGSGTLEQFGVAANGSAWILFKVTEATTSEYRLEGKLAVKFNGEVHAKVSMLSPEPGTYPILGIKPTSQRTVGVDVVLNMALVVDTVTTFNHTFAVKNVAAEVKGTVIASVDLTNIPKATVSGSNVTWAYEDYHIRANVNVDVNLNLAFEPALNIIEFPLNVGDAWRVNSTGTLTGSLSGNVDVQGLPANIEQSIFENKTLQDLGITSFPVDLSKLSVPGSINNGTLVPKTIPVNLDMHCTGNETRTTPFYGLVTIYEVQVNGGQKFYYSDDVKFLTMFNATIPDTGGVLPSQLAGMGLDMPATSPATAEQQVNSIESYQNSLSNQGSGSNLGLDLAVVALIAIVAIAAIGVAVVVLVRRKK